jgi:hypothetical protein
MIGGAVMTSLMLPLSGDLFDPPAEATVDNLLICAAVHESGYGPSRHIASRHQPGRKRGKAEIDGQASIAEDDACHPATTSEPEIVLPYWFQPLSRQSF